MGTTIATMNVYRVKPAVFDLFLSAAIGCYLGILYLILNNSSGILLFLASFVKEKKETDNHHHHSNGHVKANGIRNGGGGLNYTRSNQGMESTALRAVTRRVVSG